MRKSEELIPLILQADDEDKAIDVLNEVLECLYLTSDYIELKKLKDRFEELKSEANGIIEMYKANYRNQTLNVELMDQAKTELNFMYIQITDELAFDSSRLKIFYEEKKTVQRFDSMYALSDDEISNKFKAKSASALREIMGADPGYRQFVSLAAISYGLWNEVNKYLESIKLLTDTIAGQLKRELIINVKDQK
jgi:hypothetical protein